MAYFVAAIGWLVVAASLMADPIIRLLTVPAYFDSADAVPLLALSAAVYGMYFIAGVGASRVKQTGYHILVAAAALTVSLAANLYLVPRHGYMGAAAAMLIANATLSGAMFLRSQRVFPVKYPWRRIATAGVLVLAAVGLTYALPAGELWTLAPRLAAIAAFPLLLFATGFFPANERASMRRRLIRR
jgi:O-antigen/teichoic acid export membrane protein